MLATTKLTYKYANSKPIFYPDIKVEKGNALLILGQSGVGKSTLLHMLGGLMPPTAGKVVVNDISMNDLSQKELDKFRGSNIGIVFQKSIFMQALTVKENLQLCRKLAGLTPNDHRIAEVLARLGIPHKSNSKPNELSQGEQQRLSIARAVISEPSILLADEPSSALDDEHCLAVTDLLREQMESENCALIIVTHDQRISDRFENQLILTPKNKQI